MLRTIRRSVFETNSSSTHSITMCLKEDYDKWKNGELLFDGWTNTFIKSPEEAKYKDEVVTYDEYWDDEYLETFENTYTTKSGEVIIAFGKYGYDG